MGVLKKAVGVTQTNLFLFPLQATALLQHKRTVHQLLVNNGLSSRKGESRGRLRETPVNRENFGKEEVEEDVPLFSPPAILEKKIFQWCPHFLSIPK